MLDFMQVACHSLCHVCRPDILSSFTLFLTASLLYYVTVSKLLVGYVILFVDFS